VNTIISTVFVPVTKGRCEVCDKRPAVWKYICGPIETENGLFPDGWDKYDGEAWCERCRKLYDLEKLLDKVEGLETELALIE
jgi:hypothetical protein